MSGMSDLALLRITPGITCLINGATHIKRIMVIGSRALGVIYQR